MEFFYGADVYLNTVEKWLRSMYSATFDIERVEIDVATAQNLICKLVDAACVEALND